MSDVPILQRFSRAACLIFFACATAAGQAVTDGNSTGLPPFGSFHGSNFDLVSFQNGNLHIEIPLVSAPQRERRMGY